MRNSTARLLSMGLLLTCLSPIAADEVRPLSPEQPAKARLSNPVLYDVEFAVTVTAPYKTKKLRIWLPIPPSTDGQEISGSEITVFPMDVRPTYETEHKFGNRFAYFEFANPEGAQIIRHRFKIKVWEMHWDLDPAKVEKVMSWPAAFKPFLVADSSVAISD